MFKILSKFQNFKLLFSSRNIQSKRISMNIGKMPFLHKSSQFLLSNPTHPSTNFLVFFFFSNKKVQKQNLSYIHVRHIVRFTDNQKCVDVKIKFRLKILKRTNGKIYSVNNNECAFNHLKTICFLFFFVSNPILIKNGKKFT